MEGRKNGRRGNGRTGKAVGRGERRKERSVRGGWVRRLSESQITRINGGRDGGGAEGEGWKGAYGVVGLWGLSESQIKGSLSGSSIAVIIHSVDQSLSIPLIGLNGLRG